MPIPVYDTATYYTTKRAGLPEFVIVNILGFFIESVDNKGTITGVLATNEGELISGTSTVGPQSAFNLIPALIQ